MKFLHLSDLHLGLRLHEISMLDEQRHLLNEVVRVAGEQNIDAVLICGDVYDKSIPPAEAVQLFDSFLTELSALGVPTLVSSGNHDSAERLSFGSSIMAKNNLYISPVYNGELTKITLNDEFGEVDFFMLPFVKPANVRRFFPDDEINDYTDAIRVALQKVDGDNRKVLLCHQNVTDPSSGERIIGGLDNVDASVFEAFDYVALGHIHLSYSIIRDSIRYCGTNLCYDFKQVDQTRGLDVVTIDSEGNCSVERLPFTPIHAMRCLRGALEELTDVTKVDKQYVDSYLRVTLTDEEETIDAIGRLRAIYPLMLVLDYDNTRTRTQSYVLDGGETDNKSPFELFSEFYEIQNGQAMSERQAQEIDDIIKKVWGETV